MDASVQNQERVPENLNKLLAVAVRSIQWSYAIFWSLSSRQQGYIFVSFYSSFIFFAFYNLVYHSTLWILNLMSISQLGFFEKVVSCFANGDSSSFEWITLFFSLFIVVSFFSSKWYKCYLGSRY